MNKNTVRATFLFCLLILCANSQYTFNSQTTNAASKVSLTSNAYGVAVKVASSGTDDFAWMILDTLSLNAAATSYFITPLSMSGNVDVGVQQTPPTNGWVFPDGYYGSNTKTFVPLANGRTNEYYTALWSAYYPTKPSLTPSDVSLVLSVGSTYQWILSKPASVRRYSLVIQAYPSNTQLYASATRGYDETDYLSFGFETTGTGSASFCLQTLAQVTANPGICVNCSNGTFISGDGISCGLVAHCQSYSNGTCQSCVSMYQLNGDTQTCYPVQQTKSEVLTQTQKILIGALVSGIGAIFLISVLIVFCRYRRTTKTPGSGSKLYPDRKVEVA